MKLAWDAAKRTEKRDGGYHRERSDDPYHSFRWTRLSRVWRMEHPLCEECRKRGIVKRAEVVDHIIPWPVCRDFFDRTNLQSLCADCNTAKGNRDKKMIQEWRTKNER